MPKENLQSKTLNHSKMNTQRRVAGLNEERLT